MDIEGLKQERPGAALNGVAMLVVVAALGLAGVGLGVLGAITLNLVLLGVAVALVVVGALLSPGFLVLQPNEASVLIVLGSYQGTVRQPGLWWVNPIAIAQRQRISLRAHNFNSQTSKVNDANGNPINIAAVIVWQVFDTARATFDVADYDDFVVVQSETAIRHLARSYPYDLYDESVPTLTLMGDSEEIEKTLTDELEARLSVAGVHVIEARITDLSYAPEIADAMLRRQQAGAIVAARTRIVEGAVGMVQLALEALEANAVVELDEERKATMVSNLLTVLTSDQPTNPIVNVGTLNR
ncbi:MAG: SPFH domain-containing protein [Dehalococcoidia bacterium]